MPRTRPKDKDVAPGDRLLSEGGFMKTGSPDHNDHLDKFVIVRWIILMILHQGRHNLKHVVKVTTPRHVYVWIPNHVVNHTVPITWFEARQ